MGGGIDIIQPDEGQKFVEDTEFQNIARRTVIYEYLSTIQPTNQNRNCNR